MKQLWKLLVLAPLLLAAGCGTMDQNVKARRFLALCRFEPESLDLARVNFDGAVPKSADFTMNLKITNPTESDVALDRAEAAVYLDEVHVGTVKHGEFSKIEARTASSEKLDLSIPLTSLAKSVKKKAENIIVDGTVWVTILMGTTVLETSLPVKIRKSYPVPYDRIERAIEKKARETLENLDPKDLMEKGKKLRKKIMQ